MIPKRFEVADETMKNNSSAKTHVVMLPFMARGHLIPFLALAKQIEQRTGFTITIVSTPLNIQQLKSTASISTTTATINFAELPFCSSDHGLPPNSENTDSLHASHIITLLEASQTLQPSFHHFISNMSRREGHPPLCIISDVFMGWAVNVARSFGTPHFTFSTGGAFGTAAYFSLWLNLPHRNTTSDEFSVPGFPDTCNFHRSQLHPKLRDADGTDLLSRLYQKLISLSLGSNGMLCNTVEEIEPMGMYILKKSTGLPVWSIGPLLPLSLLDCSSSPSSSTLNVSVSRSGKQTGITSENCVNWLNSHSPNSVLYISFGSQNTINSTQMMELAMGLEVSGNPFIWVMRPPIGFDINGEFKAEWLPEGFEKRVKERHRGLVVHGWAPQLEILSHRSTGAFLSHCGWNSVLESLSQGVPIIGWPLAGEQAYNSKMIEEEMGVCVELTRGLESWVGREEVERVVKMVMSKEGKGEEMKKKAMEISKKIRNSVSEDGDKRGSSLTALDAFLETVVLSREREKQTVI